MPQNEPSYANNLLKQPNLLEQMDIQEMDISEQTDTILKLKNMMMSMDNRFERIDNKFDQLENTLGDLNKEIDNKFEQIENTLGDLDREIKKNKNFLDEEINKYINIYKNDIIFGYISVGIILYWILILIYSR